MRNRILFAILLPVVAVAMLVAVWAASALVPPLLGYMQKSMDSTLGLVTRLGFEKCENSFGYLLDLRLENDQSMIASLKNQTLSEIQSLSDQFQTIKLIVVDANGRVIPASKQQEPSPAMDMKDLDIRGRITERIIFGEPSRAASYYFPFWRWYVVGYIHAKDYASPLSTARKVIFGGTSVVLLATILTAALAFYLHVRQPLKLIINASEKVAAGEFKKVEQVGKDEIGTVTQAFNSMVDSLEADQQKINAILSALRESEELYRLVTENSMSQIMLIDKGKMIFANQRVLQDTDYTMAQLHNKGALSHIHPEDRATVRRMVRKRITGHPIHKPLECRYLTRSGEVRWAEVTVVPAIYQGKMVVLIHGTDVTQRKASHEEQQRLETKLRQAQKMEAIGTLAGGIAHDFNNLLMGIQGNATLLELDLKSDAGVRDRLQNIQKYVQNGSNLTRQLLGYARSGKYEVKPTDINALISQSVRMFGRTKKEVVVKLDLQAGIWTVEVDCGQIEQVLLNLYVNAWQAMPRGGDLIIKTDNLTLDQAEEKTLALGKGDYVSIEVTDTGVGMDAETTQKIFDPFFTTKQRERGTGLGLASAYGIIENHGGAIVCKSKPDSGTSFWIYLPRSDKAPKAEKVVPAQVESGTETILLVDDESMIIEVGKEMLATLGYDVLTADSGMEAVRILEQNHRTIDLVILDMIMPEMGGAETFKAIRQIDRQMPVLLCSGYSLDGLASRILKSGCDGFIQKPFDINKLSRHVRKILESKSCAPGSDLKSSI